MVEVEWQYCKLVIVIVAKCYLSRLWVFFRYFKNSGDSAINLLFIPSIWACVFSKKLLQIFLCFSSSFTSALPVSSENKVCVFVEICCGILSGLCLSCSNTKGQNSLVMLLVPSSVNKIASSLGLFVGLIQLIRSFIVFQISPVIC